LRNELTLTWCLTFVKIIKVLYSWKINPSSNWAKI